MTLCCGVSIPDDSKDHCSFIFRVLDCLTPRDELNVENYSHSDTETHPRRLQASVAQL